ncbi:MAG TPA: hypothetical protein VNK70_00765 [Candidatus Paceibacterota bacterium]|nr:hypothetical protein [Candidatus Paceibacterota bacterium]
MMSVSNFTKKMEEPPKKILRIFVIALLLLGVILASFYWYKEKTKAQNLSALVGGAGWIKFNSEPIPGSNLQASTVNYGVYVHRDGKISGAAWSSVYGWLSFNEADLAGCPSGPCVATMDLPTGAVSGWAKFLGIDQWVHLRGTAGDGTPYGVSFNPTTGEFSGQAWGSDLVGWINFSSQPGAAVSYAVKAEALNQPPVVSNVSISEPTDNWCLPNPSYFVNWTYSDPDIPPASQIQAVIEFFKSNGTVSMSANPTQAGGTYSFADPLGYIANGSYNGTGFLEANTSYKARVKAYDGVNWSDWAESTSTITTPPHYYPLVQSITWTPTPAKRAQTITFTANVTDRSAGAASNMSYAWTFENASPAASTAVSPEVIFSNLPAGVQVTVTDSDGHGCVANQTVQGTGTLDPSELKRRIFRER